MVVSPSKGGLEILASVSHVGLTLESELVEFWEAQRSMN